MKHSKRAFYNKRDTTAIVPLFFVSLLETLKGYSLETVKNYIYNDV